MKRARIAAFLAIYGPFAAYADGQAGDYFVTNIEQCALDSAGLPLVDTLVLRAQSISGHGVNCHWAEALDFDALVGQTVIAKTTCGNGDKSWTDEYSFSVPVLGSVATKPVRVQGLPTLFYRCE